MPRIRTIKPEFPQSETVGKLSRDARLLFIQLWTILDDEGRARASSRMLASLLYPYDDDAPPLIDRWMDELEAHGCVRRYEVEGSHFLDVPNWLKHQKIDRPTASKLPSFDEASRGLASAHRGLAADLGPRTKDQGKDSPSLRSGESARASEIGNQISEIVEWEPTPPAEPRPEPDPPKRATRLPADFDPDLGDALVQGLSLDQALSEAAKFKDHFAAAPGQRGVKQDWPATWRNWCRRAGEMGLSNGKRPANGGNRSASRDPHEPILREIARQFAPGLGQDEREADADDGAQDHGAGGGSDPGSTLSLPRAAYRRT